MRRSQNGPGDAVLVGMTGLAGTGTSDRGTGRPGPARRAPVRDPIDATLSGLVSVPGQRPDIVGLDVMKTLAREQLALGLSVVVDAVNPLLFVREDDAEIAGEFSSALVVIVNVCSDSALHRESSGRWATTSTTKVTASFLDAVDLLEQNIAAALGAVESDEPGPRATGAPGDGRDVGWLT